MKRFKLKRATHNIKQMAKTEKWNKFNDFYKNFIFNLLIHSI